MADPDRPGERPGATAGWVALARPSGWKRIRLFGASSRAQHIRRRGDLITLGVAVLALAVVLPGARSTDGLEEAVLEAIGALPSVLDPLFAFAYDALAVLAAASLLLALVRKQWRLALRLVAVVPTGLLATALANRGLGLDGSLDALEAGAPVGGVPVQLALAIAMASVASREMSRPFRTASRRLVAAGTLGALLLPVGTPLRVTTAVLVAVVTVSAVRYVLGSPLTSISADDVRDDLADLGVVAQPVEEWAAGRHEAVTATGDRLAVRVLGRDEWDNQVAAVVWRLLWYRNSTGRLLVSPRQLVEHQAFVALLARSRGAPVAPIVAAGASRTGDALVATRIEGDRLSALPAPLLDDEVLDACWRSLADLHRAGVTHGAIDGSTLELTTEGEVAITAFEHAEPLTEPAQAHADRAQLLVTTTLLVGTDRAVAAALRAPDADDAVHLDALVSFLQPAALDDALRLQVADAELSLEELREAVAAAAGREIPELQKIWRVSWGAVIRLALLGAVGYLLISQLADIGWDTIVESVAAANPWLLAAALVFGQVPRVATAASLRAASPTPVPLERVTRLQFAATFINLAVPSTAARVATSIRFFQRSGATPGGALSAGALDSFAGFLAQILLLGGLLLAGLGTLGWDGTASEGIDRADLLRVVLVLVAIVAALVVLVLAIAPLRSRAAHLLGQLREALAVLRSPATVVRLLGFNLLAELLFSTTIWVVLHAFGQQVSLVDVVIINVAVALFAGLMPVPGGVGITEGALTAGFVAVGVPEAIAFSAAVTYRLCTFYLPPLWGYLAMRSLRREGFL